jgi:hypothetical protein
MTAAPLVSGRMLDHLSLRVADVDAAAASYTRVFGPVQRTGTEIPHSPQEWPQYHPRSYGVFVRDRDGNNVEAVHHGSPA